MSNDYYNDTGTLENNTLARAPQVVAEFQTVEAGFDKLPGYRTLNENRIGYLADTGAADAYVVTFATAPIAYNAGLHINMKVATTNTGASTVNVNSLGVKAIKRADGTDVVAGDLTAGRIVSLIYDGTNFQLIAASNAELSTAVTAAQAAQTAAETAQTNAETAETNAAASAAAASTSETNAAASEAAAAQSAIDAAGAVGGVKVSSNDTTPGDLETKLIAGTHVVMATANDGANETRSVSVTISGNADGAINMLDYEFTRPKLKDYAETLVTANTGTAYTADLENGNVLDLTLTGNCTFTFSNPPASGTAGAFTMILTQDGTGSRTVTWPASVEWAGGTAPTITATAGGTDVFTFITVDGGTTWRGFTAGQDFS
jgi:hypothetical protein